jgi:hypothetical protein
MKNNNTFIKVGAILMFIAMVSLFGCRSLNEDTAEKVVKALEDKYGVKFKATAIGERFGTKTNDTVTTYISPEDNEDIVFEAKMNKDGELIFDNYIARKVAREVEHAISNRLEENAIDAEAKTVAYGADSSKHTDPSITLQQYIETYSPEMFISYIVVKEDTAVNAKGLVNAYEKILEDTNGVSMEGRIKVVSASDYEECVKELRKVPDVTKTWFNNYDVVHEFILTYDAQNGFSMTEQEIEEMLKAGE